MKTRAQASAPEKSYRMPLKAREAHAPALNWLMQLSLGLQASKPSRMVDVNAVDLGVAYVLMLAALFVTYFVR
ncbi:hypothetical protein HPP92_009110 [Vanilla planifolia]|uniref:Uncharacterized protein n=1 Tax=Vanilla planifolia TaxID=51239 RepID=A0A835R3N7_VANPL|nr:hypothetical protein HPP92_009110 [Vanilla planifolia]